MIANVTEQLWIDFDLDTAVFLDNLLYWLRKSIINKEYQTFHDDRHWIQLSHNQFSYLFRGWSISTIRRIIRNCVKNGLLLTNQFSTKKDNQALWYSLTELGLTYFGSFAQEVKP